MGAKAFQPGRGEAGPNQPGHDVGIGGIDCVETALMASLSSSATAMEQNGEGPNDRSVMCDAGTEAGVGPGLASQEHGDHDHGQARRGQQQAGLPGIGVGVRSPRVARREADTASSSLLLV